MAGPLSPPTMFESRGTTRVHVDGHGEERVDQRHGVGAGVFCGAGERRDVGDIRRQLGDDRQTRHPAHRADDLVGARQAAAERDAPFFDVGARDIQLEGVNPLGVGEDSRELDIFVERGPADVDDHDGAQAPELRQLLGDEAPHADALQPDRIQHARRGFHDPRRRVTFAFGEEEPFDGDRAERLQVHGVGVLDAVAEAAARGNQRVGEAERSDLKREIHRQCPTASHTTRWASKTGPSMQVRVWCTFPSSVRAATTQL